MGSITAIKDRDATPGDAPAIDTADVRKRLQANGKALASYFCERTEIVVALNVALVAGEHVLMVGPPGTAKSALARSWGSQVDGVYREDLLTRQSTEADHLAYLDVQAFTAGRYVYRTEGKLTEAHVAFVDEAFKATGGFLNALLGWLNERNVRGGYKSPLITAIAASNEFGEDDSVAALEDRLLIRFHVSAIADRTNRITFLRGVAAGATPPALAKVSIPEIEAAQREAIAIPVDPAVFEALCDLQAGLAGAGVVISDRRLGKCLRILQAFAWCDGAGTVELDHLDILAHVLWRRPEEQTAVKAALGAVNRGIVGEIRTIVERALDAYNGARNASDFDKRALEVAQTIKIAAEEVRDRFGGKIPPRARQRANDYLTELKEAFAVCKAAAKLTPP